VDLTLKCDDIEPPTIKEYSNLISGCRIAE